MLADPAAGLRVVERVQHRVGIEDRVVPPAAVLAVGRLALGLEELVPRGAGVPHLHRRAEPDLGEHLPERLEVRTPVHRGAVQRDVDPVRIAPLRQELPGFLLVVRVRLHRRIESERRRLDDRRDLLAQPRHHLLDHRLLVDRVVRRLADGLLVERRAPHVEGDVVHAEDRRRADPCLGMILDIGQEVGVDVADDVDAAGLELGHRGRDLGDRPEDDVLERGLAAPVLVERLEPDVLVALPLHELPGAGAHGRRAAERFVADLLDVLLRHDAEVDQTLEQEREGLVGDQLDRVRVDDLHFLDRADVAVLGRLLLLLARLQHALERELHVLGRHRRAVVELDTPPELELPRRVVERLPRHGQRGLEFELGGAMQERVEHVDVDQHAHALEVHVGVEGRRVGRQRDRQGVLALRPGADRHEERGENQGHHEGEPMFHEVLLADGSVTIQQPAYLLG